MSHQKDSLLDSYVSQSSLQDSNYKTGQNAQELMDQMKSQINTINSPQKSPHAREYQHTEDISMSYSNTNQTRNNTLSQRNKDKLSALGKRKVQSDEKDSDEIANEQLLLQQENINPNNQNNQVQEKDIETHLNESFVLNQKIQLNITQKFQKAISQQEQFYKDIIQKLKDQIKEKFQDFSEEIMAKNLEIDEIQKNNSMIVEKLETQIYKLTEDKDQLYNQYKQHMENCNMENLKMNFQEEIQKLQNENDCQKENLDQLQQEIQFKDEKIQVYKEGYSQIQIQSAIENMSNLVEIQSLKNNIKDTTTKYHEETSKNKQDQKQLECKLLAKEGIVKELQILVNDLRNQIAQLQLQTSQNNSKISDKQDNCINEKQITQKTEELKKQMQIVKKKIYIWQTDFEQKEKRKPQTNDKLQIKNLYQKHQKIQKELKELEEKSILQQNQSNIQIDSKSRSVSPIKIFNNVSGILQSKRNLSINQSFDNSINTSSQIGTPNQILTNSILNSNSNQSISSEYQKSQKELKFLKQENEKLKIQINRSKQPDNDQIKAYQTVIQNLEKVNNEQKEKLIAYQNEDNAEKIDELQQMIIEKDQIINKLSDQLTNIKTQIQECEKDKQKFLQITKDLEYISQANNSLQNELQLCQKYLYEEKEMKKILHNELQDMKGKIRVFCRVRPLLKYEQIKNCKESVKISDDMSLICSSKNGTKTYQFDQCWGPNVEQGSIFQEVKKLVQCAFDGYNACIFAYGQTGSGKTYTMAGTKENPGITPRTVEEIFNNYHQIQSVYQVKVVCYMVEIYQDNLIDLFSFKETNKKLEIKEGINGTTYIQNVTQIKVNSKEDLNKLINSGIQNRKTGKTDMNEDSSRSHLVITIQIEQQNKENESKIIGKISLVDLAGSERVNKANLNMNQIKETRSINKSLSALGDVISALTNPQEQQNEKHIPYRNNKLTHLMKDSLGGNAKTLMFVNISPSDFNMEESLNSLNYASRVKQITNNLVKNVETKEYQKLQSLYRQQCEECDQLRKMVQKNDMIPRNSSQISPSPHKSKRRQDSSDSKYDIPPTYH